MNRWRIPFFFILSVTLIAGVGYYGFQSSPEQTPNTPQEPATIPVVTCDIEQTVTAPGRLVNTQEVKIEMPVAGRLAEINVRPGDYVEAEQVLARLDDPEKLAAAVSEAELALLQAQKELNDLYRQAPQTAAQAQVALAEAEKALVEAQKARDRLNYARASGTTLKDAQERLDKADKQLALAQKAYNDLLHLPKDHPKLAAALLTLIKAQTEQANALNALTWYQEPRSDNEIALADARLALAQANLEQAQALWESLNQGPDPLEVSLAEARLITAQDALKAAQAALEHEEIRAPFSGVILEVKAQAGESLAAGASIFVINDPQAVEVESTVIEEELPYVQVGQPTSLYFDALPTGELAGTVSRIVPIRAAGDSPMYYVYMTLENVPPALVAGMSVDAAIVIAERKDVLCLPRSLARTSADGMAYLDVWNGREVEKRTVEVGLRGDSYVEILSGLEEGDLVLTR